MAENLNEIWAKSNPLATYFAEKLAIVEGANSESLSTKLKNSELPEGANSMTIALSSAARTLIISQAQSEYRKRAMFVLRNELVAGELKLIGIASDTGNISVIDANYWISAELVPETNDALSDVVSYRDLRVVSPKTIGATARKLAKGPKNYQQDRIEVISACIDESLVDFARHNLDGRFGIYRSWIEKNRPEWNVARGFSKKAFEADEPSVKSMKNIS